MIIKKWDATLNSGAGGWLAQSAKTNAVDLVVDVTAGSPVSIFEIVGSTPKIKTTYLPNAVFDSLYFVSSASTPTQYDPQGGPGLLRDMARYALDTVGDRSILGAYYVASEEIVLQANSTSATDSYGTPKYWITKLTATDEGTLGTAGNMGGAAVTTTLEIGDWIVITNVTGLGTSGSPYIVTFSTVENTYEIMGAAAAGTAGTPGLVPSSSAGDQAKFLRADATWATPVDTNTTYAISTVNGDANSTKIRLTDSAAAIDEVTIAVGTVGSTHGLTIAQASDVITIKHADTSSQSSVTAAARTYITAVSLDEFGHVTSLSTGTETVVDTNTTYSISAADGTAGKKIIRLTAGGSGSGTDDVTLVQGTNTTLTRTNDEITIEATAYTAGNGISLASYQFSVGAGVGLTQEATGLKMTQPFIASASAPAASYQVANNLWFDIA